MTRSIILMIAIFAATWHAWLWYANRIWATPEEGAALALTVAFVLALGWRHRTNSARRRPADLPLWTASLLLLAYAASFNTLPPIGNACIAVTTVMACLYTSLMGSRPPVAFWGMIALSLPVLPSLQFTLGFGMRVVSAAMTVFLLRVQGLDVARQGTFLIWRGELVQFDAPCSGVNMLWAGLLIAFMACVAMRLDVPRTILAVVVSVIATVAGNVLRASSLFYVETGLMTGLPPAVHEAVGVASFMLSAVATLWLASALEPRPRMAQ